jgi:succinyl-CoA synthetase alpha subunit
MPSGFVIRKNAYYDSVFLMGINKRLSEFSGVEQTAVLMGTEANKRLLTDIGITGTEIETALANDLIVAVVAETSEIVNEVIDNFDGTLRKLVAGTRSSDVHTLSAAIERKSEANLAVFSIPGDYVANEARSALENDLNVFIFSSNVPLEQELELKQIGHDRNLLVMGPDCGTSIINGTGIGFANAVRRGTIGVVGPSGTGLQEFTCLVHNAGGGISHAIGTGSNDLSDKIGGLTTLAAMQALESDPQTEVIAIIAKPPETKTLAALISRAETFEKPMIGCFLGSDKDSASHYAPIEWAYTIDDAAALALKVGQVVTENAAVFENGMDMGGIDSIRAGWSSDQQYLRGVFAGGTFCYQAQQVLGDIGLPLYSNSPIDAKFKLKDPDLSLHHTMRTLI